MFALAHERWYAFSVALAASAVMTPTASFAGGFAIDGQSAVFEGTSFAGSAAGGSLSSMFWNAAAAAELRGANAEVGVTYIIGEVEVSVESAQTGGAAAPIVEPFFREAQTRSGDIFPDTLVAASYANQQVTDRLFIGLALNAPFGLETEPAERYAGAPLGRKTKLVTGNANPTIAYKLAPGVTIGVGAQIEYADGRLEFATGIPLANSTKFGDEDWAFGATAGIMLEPLAGTTIGLGWRSALTHTFEGRLGRRATGSLAVPGLPAATPAISSASIGAEADLHLPEIVTLGLRHELTPGARMLASVQWTNWSRFDELELTATEDGINPVTDSRVAAGDTLASIETNWSDSWFLALGGEVDVSPRVTLRTGAAYEISPVRESTQRLTTIPDADRVWLSLGASYHYSEATTFDLAYSHVFVRDGAFEQTTLGDPAVAATTLTGTIDTEFDGISLGMRTKW